MATYIKSLVDENNDWILPRTRMSAVTNDSGISLQEAFDAKTNLTVVADAYDATATYAVGDYCIHSGAMFVCNTAISSPEAWTAAHWTSAVVGDKLSELKSSKVDKADAVTIVKLTDGTETMAQLKARIDAINLAGDHVFFDTASLGYPLYLCTIYIGYVGGVPVSYKVTDLVTGSFATGTYSAGKTLSAVLSEVIVSSIRTFQDVKYALNANVDLSSAVGAQVTCTRGNATLTWDIVDYDSSTHEVTLLMHETLQTKMLFEPSQALTYFENGLSAGNYSFNVGSTTYYFTLNSAIPAGGQLRATTSQFFTYASQDATSTIASGSVSTTAISGATSLGTTGTGTLNHMDRVNNGSNNFGESGLFAWLNSNASPNTNIHGVCKFSRAYSTGNYGGFLNGFKQVDLDCVENSTWTVTTNNTYEAPASMGGISSKSSSYSVNAKFALAHGAKMYGADRWDLYVGTTESAKTKYYLGSARPWWRIDEQNNPSQVLYVGAGGEVYAQTANNGNQSIVPCCKIKKDA